MKQIMVRTKLIQEANKIDKELKKIYDELPKEIKATHDATNMIFDIYDVDKDGHLAFDEIKKYMDETNASGQPMAE